MLDVIQYDRSERIYRLTDPATGEIVNEFPAGRDGRQAAFRAGVQTLSPSLYDLVMKAIGRNPVLASRIWKACEILLSGGVTRFDDTTYCVQSQSANEFGDYTVSILDGGHLHCDCADIGLWLPSGQPVCKHRLAVIIGRKWTPETPY